MLRGDRAAGKGEEMCRAGERGGDGDVSRGEDGRLRGLFNRLRIEFGDASGLPGGLGVAPGEYASMGVMRRVAWVGEALKLTSST